MSPPRHPKLGYQKRTTAGNKERGRDAHIYPLRIKKKRRLPRLPQINGDFFICSLTSSPERCATGIDPAQRAAYPEPDLRCDLPARRDVSRHQLAVGLLHLADNLAGPRQRLDHVLALLPSADGEVALLQQLVEGVRLVHFSRSSRCISSLVNLAGVREANHSKLGRTDVDLLD